MTAQPEHELRLLRLERTLAALLRHGALVASAWITLGMILALLGTAAPQFATPLAEACLAVGIVLLIALPVLRVALTAAIFLFERDYVFAAVSSAVLIIILSGLLVGTIAGSTPP